MLPALLITLRETIEASLIIATLLGILAKLGYTKGIKSVWSAALLAIMLSIILLYGGALFGLKVQEIYSGKTEQMIEGSLMMISAFFITWAIFVLHSYFSQYKVRLLKKVNETIDSHESRGLFILAFTAVFREGIEIVLFLTTIYFSSDPMNILSGFGIGLGSGIIIALLFFTATLRLPVYYAFRASSILLVLFTAGLLARGVHEFTEAGVISEFTRITLPFIPTHAPFLSDTIKSLFGITHSMNLLQILFYVGYIGCMYLWFSPQRAIISKCLQNK